MEVDLLRGKRKRAISGIVAAVIMFAMLFTVGTGFFLFVNTNNNFYDQALSARNSAQQSRLSESLQVTTLKLADGNIGFYANNTGGIGVNITALYVLYSGKPIAKCMGVGLPTSSCTLPNNFPSCQLPAYLNVGSGTKAVPAKSGSLCASGTLTTIDTGQPANQTTAAVTIITQRGNAFSATYPPSATALASEALSSGAIGDIYLNPATFTYYEICTTASGSCTPCSTAPCYLQKVGYAFSIPSATAKANNLAFALQVTDFNPTRLNITLDQYTLMSDFFAPQGSSSSGKGVSWYIISNSSNTQVSSTYSPLTLQFNVPITLVFGSSTPGTFTGFTYTFPSITFPIDALIFMLTHGCKAVKAANCNYQTPTYSQNSPYITTLFY